MEEDERPADGGNVNEQPTRVVRTSHTSASEDVDPVADLSVEVTGAHLSCPVLPSRPVDLCDRPPPNPVPIVTPLTRESNKSNLTK